MKLVNSEKIINKPLVWLEISKDSLSYNLSQVRDLVGSSKVMAVLKANAYGLGVLGVAKVIEKQVDAFGVVGAKEALALREAGIKKPIVNLGIYSSGDAEPLIKNKIFPTVFTDSAFQDFQKIAVKLNTRGGVWIKVDTGLSRAGVPDQDAFELIETASETERVRIEGVFSSFTEDQEQDRDQLKRFVSLREKCQKEGIEIPIWSIASSEAAFLFPESGLDMVRLGIALFGFYPSPEARSVAKVKLRPAVSFKTRVACVKELEKGESVFYRCAYVVQKKTRVAMLLPGYSYGIDSRIVNGGEVLINGRKYPLVGGVAMTNSFADVGDDKSIKAGDEVVVFGKQGGQEIGLEEICNLLQQSEYEFLSRIPEKVERVYI